MVVNEIAKFSLVHVTAGLLTTILMRSIAVNELPISGIKIQMYSLLQSSNTFIYSEAHVYVNPII